MGARIAIAVGALCLVGSAGSAVTTADQPPTLIKGCLLTKSGKRLAHRVAVYILDDSTDAEGVIPTLGRFWSGRHGCFTFRLADTPALDAEAAPNDAWLNLVVTAFSTRRVRGKRVSHDWWFPFPRKYDNGQWIVDDQGMPATSHREKITAVK